jgi:ribosomal protein L11 methyltransferase
MTDAPAEPGPAVTPVTWTAFTQTPERARAEALGEAIEGLLAPEALGVLEVEDGTGTWEVGVYFDQQPDIAVLSLLAAVHGVPDFVISELPPTDWVAKVRRDLKPIHAGRFWVHGSHDAGSAPAGTVPLLIEAAVAFGTGHHGTTQGCLIALDRLVAEGLRPTRVADIGCGTAVLAMAAASVTGAEVVASDVDPVAVDVAVANLAANGMASRVACVVAEGFDNPALQGAPFDLILANILKGPLIALAPEMAARIVSGGHLILSGILNEQAQDVRDVYRQSGFNEVESLRIGDWTTLILRKTGP